MTREEAIEVYNGLINTKIKEAFEFFAPELRESEDERFRKYLLEGCKASVAAELGLELSLDITRKLLSWLEKQKDSVSNAKYIEDVAHAFEDGRKKGVEEKQKEQPISAEEVLARAGLKPYKDGNQWCILAGDNIQEGICGFGDTIEDALYEFLKEVLDLQKEQKPAEKSSMLKILKEHLANTPREQLDAEFEALKDLTIDKPTWSEEDERIRKLLIWQVHRNIEDETNDLAQSVYDGIKGHDPDLEKSIEDWKKCLAWLKSLPERFNLQPKQEWSEEDEKNLELVTDCVYEFYPDPVMKYKLKDWLTQRLKSLRTCPSWKPSYHQMNILKAVKEYVGRGSGYWGEGLGSLIEDLEKLM